ncbi:glycosyltransferase family 87 protein [Nocardioides sp. LS1]|uniref:glycosyltransferase family 87 protein n=1 Tax=Nocardioides sp. LS1 TaxID=1027620 RepID=UPI000FF98260|nr:glycosyltransferase 87 family protein [Nocardioides sp. LS1]GCD90241.1 membrane protein [Nocardioides sp. LS1]
MTTDGDRDDRVHPTREDPVATALSEGIGGPMGAHGRGHRWWTPVRVVLLLTALCFALGMVQKSSCYAQTWQNGTSRYSHMCYSDMPYLYTGRGFAELNWPYTGDPQVRARYEVMEYPVGISYFAYAAAWVTHWGSGSPDITERFGHSVDYLFSEAPVRSEVRLFVVVSALGLAAAALLAAWFLASLDRLRPWDALLFALSPALALNALVNWDLLAVAATAGALWAWARGKPGLTGVLIGLGTATKLYPLFLLGGLLVICLRDRRADAFVRAVSAAIVSWVLVNAPAYLTGAAEWKVFWHFNSDRGADLGSIWLVLQQIKDTPASPFAFQAHTINTWSWLVFGTWCIGVFVVGMRAPLTPRLAQLGYLVVAGFLLVNKVYSPQYVLWLLPLAVLARPRWRDQLVWQSTEVFYFASVWWYLGGFLAPAAGGDAGFYWVAILLRMAGELFLVAMVVRDVLHPEHDPARHARLPVEPDEPAESVAPGQSTTTRSNAVAV